ncbi:MAG: SIMPL domain-containing protein [Ekhidna sp.]|uniref:SIMPL domain-containing protein n=1 Tax=Ekhidna sp. TaxID=2608089 RepID=UPI0032EEC6FA
MKYLFILLMALSLAALGQTENARIRSIEVKGSSEIEITPDEIFVRITLKEYKNGGSKEDLNSLESGLVKAIKKLGIPAENLTVENLYGYNWDWRKRKADDFLGSKSFILKVSDLKKMNDLVDLLDPEGLNNMNIQSYSHSNIEDYRRQVKIGAMKAGKEKATYLLESVDAKLGKILEVQEIDYGYQGPMMRSNMALMAEDAGGYQSEVEFMQIKVRAEMRVVFEIE